MPRRFPRTTRLRAHPCGRPTRARGGLSATPPAPPGPSRRAVENKGAAPAPAPGAADRRTGRRGDPPPRGRGKPSLQRLPRRKDGVCRCLSAFVVPLRPPAAVPAGAHRQPRALPAAAPYPPPPRPAGGRGRRAGRQP